MRKYLKNFSVFLTLLASDIIVMILCFVIAFFIRDILSNFVTIPTLIASDPIEYQLSIWWVIPLYIAVFWSQGLYADRRPFWQEMKVFIKSIFIAALLMYTIVSLGRLSPFVSRIIFILHPLLMLVLIPFARRFVKITMFNLGLWDKPIVEVKVDTDKSLTDVWESNGYIGYRVMTSLRISLGSNKRIDTLEEEVAAYIKRHHIDAIAIVTHDINDKKLSHLVEKLYFIVPQLIIVPEIMTFDVINADVYHLMYENLFMFDIKKGLVSTSNKFMKRSIDILVSGFGIIFGLPLMILIAAIIYLMDGDPVVYQQERYGKDGKVFRFMKFRSMYRNNDAILLNYLKNNPDKAKEWNDYQKLKGYDPRLIKGIGWFIRKFDLDELPQLFNVLLGNMSLVGPRPYLPRERKMIGNYFERILSVKPGITGLWQATGRNDFTFKQRLDIDTWYIQNWSLWLDFVIALKTLRKVLS